MEKKKFILPVSIIIGCIIIGGFFYVSQINKQQSIERQQELKIQADKDMERLKSEAEKEVELAKTKLETKKYLADRKQDCLDIYKTESDKWSNVRGWRFNEDDDECLIRYKDPDPKTDEECDELYPTEYFWYKNVLCKEGEFENSF
jgi:nitrogen fixation-related uncharacterized protein